jgi:hypothetical protein
MPACIDAHSIGAAWARHLVRGRHLIDGAGANAPLTCRPFSGKVLEARRHASMRAPSAQRGHLMMSFHFH